MNRRDLFVRAAAASSAVLLPNLFLIGHDEPLEGRIVLFDWVRELGTIAFGDPVKLHVLHDVGYVAPGAPVAFIGEDRLASDVIGTNAVYELTPDTMATDWPRELKHAREVAATLLRAELEARNVQFADLVRLEAPAGWVNPWNR